MKPSRNRGFTLIELMIVIAIIAILAAILVPNFIRARAQGQLTACKSNLKNIGTALEMYSTDNSGRFPTVLSQLSPNYLKTLPTCPSLGSVTYTGSGFASASSPDAYTVLCVGNNHGGAGLSANFPQYTSVQGLNDH
jgi:prepilin-type N-terminal cleavage/methylation domain-containing protein